MNVAEILTNAKFLIAQEENWCQNQYYQTKYNTDTLAYCSLGAINKVVNDHPSRENTESILVAQLLDEAVGEPVNGLFTRLDRFNDTHSHAEVMAAFDKAIELAIERGI